MSGLADILKGSVGTVTEVLPALSNDELAALLEAEQDASRPRSGVISAIEAEQAERTTAPSPDPALSEPETGAAESDESDESDASDASAPMTVTNASRNKLRVNHVELAPGESHTLSADDVGDERLLSKVNRALEIGVLTNGAD